MPNNGVQPRVSTVTNRYQTAQYLQVNLSGYHALSKRTGLYALQAFQRTNGNTPGAAGSCYIITATVTIGDGFQSAVVVAQSVRRRRRHRAPPLSGVRS
ncbi:hypothetical protein BCY88_21100 [Paraburkholderia fungorum]|uniref:Uncharacterized protein n=1 Tax=Paraburkholderia fungorum TaxID=134537 RepID=A0A3R7LC10_9BURK|nr:hypothetical protein BCY88_21100 [Paraburkholderia fungorum]